MSVAYTLPFAAPQRVAGPGSNSPADITLPEMFTQQVNFSNGGATRYMFLVNGCQANENNSNPAWNPAGGTPSTRAFIHVMKSADGGATWAEVGTPGAKQLPQKNQTDPVNTAGFRTFSAVQNGSIILVARPTWDFVTNATANPRPIVVSQFDMSVDDWAADLSVDTDPNAPIAYITSGLYPAYTPFFLCRRGSDGHIFLQWRFFDLVDNSKSGTDLVIESSTAPTTGTDLAITGGGLVFSVAHPFTAPDVGSILAIPNSAAAAGFIPGNYSILAVNGSNQATLDRSAGILTASGGAFIVTGTCSVSSISNPFDPGDVNKVLTISAHAGFNAGNYGIAAVDGGGIASIYHVGPPTNQTPGTLGASGASWSITNQTRNYERSMLSELVAGVWGVAAMVFGTVGDLIDYEPAGLVEGDGDRIHLFAQEMNPLLDGEGSANTTETILSKTLLSDGSIVGSQSFEVTARATTLPFYPPYARIKADTTLEIILPYSFVYSPASAAQFQPCEMRLYRGDSADAPAFSSDVVATGSGTLNASNFDIEFGSFPIACDLSTALLYLMVSAPFGQGAPWFVPFLLNLFTNTSWDAGVTIYDDSVTLNPLIGPVSAADNYPGFIGMSLTNGPNGEYQYDDPFYFELDFAVPQVWSIIVGTLPAGLTLNPDTGEVSGTPTTPGTECFTVQVTESSSVDCASPPAAVLGVPYSHFFPAVASPGDTATVECCITVEAVVIACGDPPNGKVNVPYSHTFPVAGGVPPLEFSITSGALPSGLELLAPDGTVEGTPSAAGLFTFEVTVTDSDDNSDSVVCRIRICPMNAQGG